MRLRLRMRFRLRMRLRLRLRKVPSGCAKGLQGRENPVGTSAGVEDQDEDEDEV
jgi:hypothetical protein